mmetsp:Transcript_177352/g.568670  ORF Transcript_177352/g.568670 Transcript_177352/m.568670 type:complete len:288 (+) Transcript_177352:105-968(+)
MVPSGAASCPPSRSYGRQGQGAGGRPCASRPAGGPRLTPRVLLPLAAAACLGAAGRLAFGLLPRVGQWSRSGPPRTRLHARLEPGKTRWAKTEDVGLNFLDDIELGMKDKTVLDHMGMSDLEADVLLKKCKSGKMNYVDFMSITCFLDHMGGKGGSVQKIAAMPDDSGCNSIPEKIAMYKAVLDAMKPEERWDPMLFDTPSPERNGRALRIREESGYTETQLNQYFYEFDTMRDLLSRLGSGKSMDEVTRGMAMDRVEKLGEGRSRSARRRLDKNIRAPKKAEWLTM